MEPFDPIAYINEPRWMKSSLGLERIELLLSKLGNPQDGFRVVHVAGTNGKGSTCAFMASCLQAAGERCGLFTSPYIERFEERIRLNGSDIPLDELSSATLAVRACAQEVEHELGEHPTEFELMCAVAFVYFARAGCSWAVVETGLGGRLDATNVVRSELSVITRIGLDHTALLGNTIAEIATEKAGIIKPGTAVVSWPQEPSAMGILKRTCADRGCSFTVSDFSRLALGELDLAEGIRHFSYRGREYQTNLLAAYQPQNAAVAIDALHALHVPEDAIQRGIAHASWSGRFEVVCKSPLVIVDGAHNPQGAEALAASLREVLSGDSLREGVTCEEPLCREERQDITFVVGVLSDKDAKGIIAPLLSLAQRFVVYAPDNPRAQDAPSLANLISKMANASSLDIEVEIAAAPKQAMLMALQKSRPESVIVAFGSLYSIGAIKGALAGIG